MSDNGELLSSFMQLGLSEQKAKETLKNAAVTKNLTLILKEVSGVANIQDVGMLLYHLATKAKMQMVQHLPTIVKYILTKKLDSTLRVDKAIEYMISNINSIIIKDFEMHCGVGIVVTPEEIEKVVETIIQQHREELLVKRYKFNVGLVLQQVRNELPWANGKSVKSEVDLQVFDLLGPKTEADLAPVAKEKKKSAKENTPTETSSKDSNKSSKDNNKGEKINCLTILDVMKKVNFHLPGENYKTDGYVVTKNTQKLIQQHLQATGGKVHTRFPPEPNGILHIGHAKAININFGYAATHGGACYLRYDDTNPEKEEEKFFVGIRDMVEWLGYKPFKVTHSSDYFDQLYEWAVQLIKADLAYVCHQGADEMKGFNQTLSPWRDRPIAENLQLFEDMKNGKIDEGAATLRMKITLEEGKIDPVAYRIRYVPHHRTGDKWCIYPTYDYTHCLCDSIENITHSLCTKEFQSRRSSYYWLCNALDIYCPVQWEYGRLNVNYTVVSKRKIAKLIEEGVVKDWDDPRLFTLTALRRRGFPSEAINNFCAQLGVTGTQSTVDPSMLEAFARDYLNNTAPRVMVVLDPLKVTISNFPYSSPVEVEVPNFPGNPALGSHKVILDRTIYIEKSDFMEVADKGYRRLSCKQPVGLRHAGFILETVSVEKNSSNEVTAITCKCTKVEESNKPKAFIHWVSNPAAIEVRLYRPLFKHANPEDPAQVPNGFLSDCIDDSLEIKRSVADKSLLSAKVYDKFQFERIGFFSVDPDSSADKVVFNQTVSLKEDAGK